MRKDPGRRTLTYGVLASALAHLLVLALHPGFELPAPPGPRTAPLVVERGIDPRIASDVARSAPQRATPVPVDRIAGDVSADDSVRSAPTPGPSRIAGAVERLAQPRDPQLWYKPAPVPESLEDRKIRELLARLEQGAKAPLTYQEKLELERAGAALGGGGGIRIPFGPKPPPPAQVEPVPPQLVALALDSVQQRGNRTFAHYGRFVVSFPQQLQTGQPFTLEAFFPAGTRAARIHVFVDGASRAHANNDRGVARVSLQVDQPGDHVILVHFIDTSEGNAQLRHTVQVQPRQVLPGEV